MILLKRGMQIRTDKNKGFSLLEMMIAIVVMAFSFGALYSAVAGASKIIRIDEKYSYAHGIAESLLAVYATVPEGGIQEGGTTEGGFHWQVTATPIEGEYPAKLPLGSIQQIDISVYWDEGQGRSINLHSVVAGTLEQ